MLYAYTSRDIGCAASALPPKPFETIPAYTFVGLEPADNLPETDEPRFWIRALSTGGPWTAEVRNAVEGIGVLVGLSDLDGRPYSLDDAQALAGFGDVFEGNPYRDLPELGDEPGDCASFSDFSALPRGRHEGPDVDNPRTLYILPDILSGGDYSGSTIHRSNHAAFLEEHRERAGVIDVSGGYGSFGVAIRLDLAPDDAEAVRETLEALQNYPVLDEEHLSQLESDDTDEQWESWTAGDFRRAVERRTGYDVSEVSDDDLRKHFEEARERANVYWEADGSSMTVDVDTVARDVAETDPDEPKDWPGAVLSDDVERCDVGPDVVALDLFRAVEQRKDAQKDAERILRSYGHRTYRMHGDKSEPWSIAHEALARYTCAKCERTARVNVRPCNPDLPSGARIRGEAIDRFCRTGNPTDGACVRCEEPADGPAGTDERGELCSWYSHKKADGAQA